MEHPDLPNTHLTQTDGDEIHRGIPEFQGGEAERRRAAGPSPVTFRSCWRVAYVQDCVPVPVLHTNRLLQEYVPHLLRAASMILGRVVSAIAARIKATLIVASLLYNYGTFFNSLCYPLTQSENIFSDTLSYLFADCPGMLDRRRKLQALGDPTIPSVSYVLVRLLASGRLWRKSPEYSPSIASVKRLVSEVAKHLMALGMNVKCTATGNGGAPQCTIDQDTLIFKFSAVLAKEYPFVPLLSGRSLKTCTVVVLFGFLVTRAAAMSAVIMYLSRKCMETPFARPVLRLLESMWATLFQVM